MSTVASLYLATNIDGGEKWRGSESPVAVSDTSEVFGTSAVVAGAAVRQRAQPASCRYRLPFDLLVQSAAAGQEVLEEERRCSLLMRHAIRSYLVMSSPLPAAVAPNTISLLYYI